jgi:iron complex transport system ATP-binding protein
MDLRVNSGQHQSISPNQQKKGGAQFAVELLDVALVREGKAILEDVSWKVRIGDHWAVVGANGSGKTTLLRMIAGYLWPTRGSIAVFGNGFGSIDLREYRSGMGWVSSTLQSRIPFKELALDVVLSGKHASIGLWEKPDPDDMERANKLLDLLGCHEHGSRSFGVLSQGEQQRVLIARALMPRPRLLVLDEPCAGLDMIARESLLDMIQELGERTDGPTLILVTHHIEEIVPIFSHVLVFKSGRVIAQGDKDKTLNDRVLSDAFQTPLSIVRINDRFWPRIKWESKS